MIKAAVMLQLLFITNVPALTDGYILTGAYGANQTVLFDKDGNSVKQWNHSSANGYSSYLLPDGKLLRSAQTSMMDRAPQNANPRQGMIEIIDSTGKVSWSYKLCNDTFMLHHDMKPMPNGNILAVTFYTISKTKAISLGVEPSLFTAGAATLLGEKIIEIKPKLPSGGEIVWEWSIFDHIVKKEDAAAHPELISGAIVPSTWQGQWVHLNGIDYSAAKDQIVFSSRIFSELFVIDHGTTTQEAASHSGGKRGKGGDILYRWGKPGNYGASGGITIDCLHSTTWIPEGYEGAGNIMFFHNNMAAIKSQVIEIKPPVDENGNYVLESGKAFGPAEPNWKYAPSGGFYSKAMSSAIRMPNGNTVAHETFPTEQFWEDGTVPQTDSKIREVNKAGEILWVDTLKLKSGMGFNPSKIMYYPSSYEGVRRLLNLPVHTNQQVSKLCMYAAPVVRQTANEILINGAQGARVSLIDLQGRNVMESVMKSDIMKLKTGVLPAGVYYVKVSGGVRSSYFPTVNIAK